MPILVKNQNSGKLPEYMMVEIQGDLQNRDENVKDCSGAFIGDVCFNQFGHPVSFFLWFFTKSFANVIEMTFAENIFLFRSW